MRSGFSASPGGYDHAPKARRCARSCRYAAFEFLGRRFSFSKKASIRQAPMLQPVGGMDRISYAIYAQVEDKVRLGSIVTRHSPERQGCCDLIPRWPGPSCARRRLLHLHDPAQRALQDRREFHQADGGRDQSRHLLRRGQARLGKSRRFWEQDDAIYGGPCLHRSAQRADLVSVRRFSARQNGILIGAYSTGAAGTKIYDAMSVAQRAPWSRAAVIERMHPGPRQGAAQSGLRLLGPHAVHRRHRRQLETRTARHRLRPAVQAPTGASISPANT